MNATANEREKTYPNIVENPYRHVVPLRVTVPPDSKIPILGEEFNGGCHFFLFLLFAYFQGTRKIESF